MLGIATMVAITEMSITTLAVDTNAQDTWQARMESAKYGTVDSIDELIDAPVIYTLNDNGEFVLEYENTGITPFGITNPPSDLAGNSTATYIYGWGTSNPTHNIYVNQDTYFNFSFDNSCTTSTAQYAEFLIGATSTAQKIYFEGSGSINTNLNISLVPISSGASGIGPKNLPIKTNNYESIYFNGLKYGETYAVKLTPKTAGINLTGTVNISNTAF